MVTRTMVMVIVARRLVGSYTPHKPHKPSTKQLFDKKNGALIPYRQFEPKLSTGELMLCQCDCLLVYRLW